MHDNAALVPPTRRFFAGLGAAIAGSAAGREPDLYRDRLVLRFAALNLGGLALLAAAWHEGWLAVLAAGDVTGLVRVIVAVFALGLVWCALRVVEIGGELNEVRRPRPTPESETARFLARLEGAAGDARGSLEQAMRQRLASRLVPIRHLASTLVLLGLIGTVLGFVIALSGVDAEAVSDVSAIAPMISTLIEGLGVALHTTLVGAVLNIWLMLDYRLLEAGAAKLHVALLERGAVIEREDGHG